MAVTTRKFHVSVDEKACKGCTICVAFCPKKVFTMNNNKAVVVDPDACTGCQLCEIYCPDFAVTVNRAENQDT
jgi:2-oxoglutarate ferredoxin oxidoreductase subunit delta